MMEFEWQTCGKPRTILEFVRLTASDRKLRLFLTAVGRHFWERYTDNRLKEVIEISEKVADDLLWKKRLVRARRIAKSIWTRIDSAEVGSAGFAAVAWNTTREKLFAAAIDVSVSYAWSANSRQDATGRWDYGDLEKLCRDFCDLLRDIFGNPFRPSTIAPEWLTWNNATIPKLAQTVYDDRRYDIMPILGDALEDAGCTDAQILDHCRGPGPHVRGCWVVDLILGKD